MKVLSFPVINVIVKHHKSCPSFNVTLKNKQQMEYEFYWGQHICNIIHKLQNGYKDNLGCSLRRGLCLTEMESVEAVTHRPSNLGL